MSGGSTLPDLDTDLNLYAVWKKNVTVTYKANGCTTGDKTVTGVMYNSKANDNLRVGDILIPYVKDLIIKIEDNKIYYKSLGGLI